MSTSTSTYLNRTTPGVYVNEIAAFGTAIVGVPTAIPVFIGYTACAGDPVTGASLYNTPVPIASMTDFHQYFGGAAPCLFTVTDMANPTPPSGGSSGGPAASGGASGSSGGVAAVPTPSFYAPYADGSGVPTSTPFLLTLDSTPGEANQFNLYWSMQAFFANGGGDCFVVSVGSYWVNEYPTPSSLPDPIPAAWVAGSIELGDPNGDVASGQLGLNVGLTAAGNAIGPTMIVVPEACQLSESDYAVLTGAMLNQAATLQDRVAIIDLPGCLTANTINALDACQTTLSTAIAPYVSSASYGAVYAPALNTTVVSANDILFTNLVSPNGDNAIVNNILTTQARSLYATNQKALASVKSAIASAFPIATGAGSDPVYSTSTTGYAVAPVDSTALAQWQLGLDNFLLNALPVFKQIEQLIAASMSTLPPSGLLAGVWANSDNLRGVWNAPANVALAAVSSPLYAMTDAQQGGFNVPTNGEAINIIRVQPGRGNVVWGARTLDGNSLDYRYIQVRRTLVYIETSIRRALQNYVFLANDATTWGMVNASISSFLGSLWQQGGLMGAKPTQAFTVACGLGSTMTAQDVLNGYMVVAITLQMVHPAEFIELTFTQAMNS